MKNKRFKIVILAMASIMILPIVYGYLSILAEMQQSVITGIITIVGIYLGGQSASDTMLYYNKDK